MRFKKFSATHLFSGFEMLDKSKVLITDETGRIEDIVDVKEAGDEIMLLEGTISPGLINCHCHLELSHMKGLIPENTGLIDFVYKVVTQRHFEEEEILAAIESGEKEMLQNGIVAVGDICNNMLTAIQKQQGLMAYYNFVEASGWLPGVADERFLRSKKAYNAFEKITGNTSIVPHAPYSVSDNLWNHIAPYFKNKVASIHNQETSFEDEFFMQGTGDFIRMYELMKLDNTHFKATGKTSLASYYHYLKNAATVLLVHNTYTSLADIIYANEQAQLYKQNLYWCLCPNANKYIQKQLADVMALVSNDCQVVLGTDSLASNHSLDILSEIRLIKDNYPFVTDETLLRWATINGARALNMDDSLGSFEKEKKPGVLLLSNNLSTVTRLI